VNTRPGLRCVCAACMYTPCNDVGGASWGEATLCQYPECGGHLTQSCLSLNTGVRRSLVKGPGGCTGSCLAGSVHNSKNSRARTKAGVGRQGGGEGKAPKCTWTPSTNASNEFVKPRPDWPIWNRTTLIVCSDRKVLIKIGNSSGTRLGGQGQQADRAHRWLRSRLAAVRLVC
jgi:hypothetical protein